LDSIQKGKNLNRFLKKIINVKMKIIKN